MSPTVQEPPKNCLASELYAYWNSLGFYFNRTGDEGWRHQGHENKFTYCIGGQRPTPSTEDSAPEATADYMSASLPARTKADIIPRSVPTEFSTIHIAILIDSAATSPDVEFMHVQSYLHGPKECDMQDFLDGAGLRHLKESHTINGQVLDNLLHRPDKGRSVNDRIDFRGIAIRPEQMWEGVRDFLSTNAHHWTPEQAEVLLYGFQAETMRRGALYPYRFRDGRWVRSSYMSTGSEDFRGYSTVEELRRKLGTNRALPQSVS